MGERIKTPASCVICGTEFFPYSPGKGRKTRTCSKDCHYKLSTKDTNDPPRGKANITGKKFQMLTVISFAGRIDNNRHMTWLCRCDCGNEVTLTGARIRVYKSCGCQKGSRKHGMCTTKIYHIYTAMIQRCYLPSRPEYRNYGGRGIKVCDRWRERFENFYEDMGERPEGMSLDRIDNDGDYSPENCRWATRIEQNNNRRDNVLFSFEGKTQSIHRWAVELGVNTARLRRLVLHKNVPFEEAVARFRDESQTDHRSKVLMSPVFSGSDPDPSGASAEHHRDDEQEAPVWRPGKATETCSDNHS